MTRQLPAGTRQSAEAGVVRAREFPPRGLIRPLSPSNVHIHPSIPIQVILLLISPLTCTCGQPTAAGAQGGGGARALPAQLTRHG